MWHGSPCRENLQTAWRYIHGRDCHATFLLVMLDLDPDHRSLPVPIYRGPRLAILAAAAVVVLAPFA